MTGLLWPEVQYSPSPRPFKLWMSFRAPEKEKPDKDRPRDHARVSKVHASHDATRTTK